MLIASGAGMVLDQGVGRYRGFALLSISMGGDSQFHSLPLKIRANVDLCRFDRLDRCHPRQ